MKQFLFVLLMSLGSISYSQKMHLTDIDTGHVWRMIKDSVAANSNSGFMEFVSGRFTMYDNTFWRTYAATPIVLNWRNRAGNGASPDYSDRSGILIPVDGTFEGLSIRYNRRSMNTFTFRLDVSIKRGNAIIPVIVHDDTISGSIVPASYNLVLNTPVKKGDLICFSGKQIGSSATNTVFADIAIFIK